MSTDGQYGWRIVLDDVDITDKVKSFTIVADLSSYCRELSFSMIDETFFDTFDFSIIPEEPRVEVYTRIEEAEDEYDESWILQGSFFVEKPVYQLGVTGTDTGIWGRQSTAILGEPFAQKITKSWDTETTFFAICEEILGLVGLSWSDSRCSITNYTIQAKTFEVVNVYPIEALRSLVNLIVGEEGFVVSDRLGNIWILTLDRNPDEYDYDLTDSVIQSVKEDPEWPEFSNRIKISATDVSSPYIMQKLYTVLSEVSPIVGDLTLKNWNVSPNKTYFVKVQRTVS